MLDTLVDTFTSATSSLKMATPLQAFVLRINNKIYPFSSSCNYFFQKRWKGSRLIYKPDGAHHVPGIPVHPDRKFPQIDQNDFAAEAEYPPVKPKFPPGSWGAMNKDFAWLWHSVQENAMNLSSVNERLNMFADTRVNAVVLDPINNHPATLPLRLYMTKTNLIPSESLSSFTHTDHQDYMSSEKFESLLNKVKEAIKDHLLLENVLVKEPLDDSSIRNNTRCVLLFRCISEAIITFFQNDFEHLQLCQYDEDALVRSFWLRFGIESKKPELPEDLDYSSQEKMLEFISNMNQTVFSEIVYDTILRSHLPLPQVSLFYNEKLDTLIIRSIAQVPRHC